MAGAKKTEQTVEENSNIDIQAMIAEALKKQQEEFDKQIAELRAEKTKTIEDESQFNMNKKVRVKNIDYSVIALKTSAGKRVIWKNNGDERYLTIGDILDLDGSPAQRLLTDPKLRVMDKEVSDYLELTSIYELIDKVEDLEAFLKEDVNVISDVLDSLPEGYKAGLADQVYLLNEMDDTAIDRGTVKRILTDKLHVDLGLRTA